VNTKDGIGPEQEAIMAESVALALLVIPNTLAPAERLAIVLHDMFAMPFDEIAPIVGRAPTAAKKLASRARHRIQGTTRIPSSDLTRQRQCLIAVEIEQPVRHRSLFFISRASGRRRCRPGLVPTVSAPRY
jgi:hypothetical protein